MNGRFSVTVAGPRGLPHVALFEHPFTPGAANWVAGKAPSYLRRRYFASDDQARQFAAAHMPQGGYRIANIQIYDWMA